MDKDNFVINQLEGINKALLCELELLFLSSRAVANTFNEFQQLDQEQMHYFEQKLDHVDKFLQPYNTRPL